MSLGPRCEQVLFIFFFFLGIIFGGAEGFLFSRTASHVETCSRMQLSWRECEMGKAEAEIKYPGGRIVIRSF